MARNFFLALLVCGAAQAGPTRMMMPEDTQDIYFGLALNDLVHDKSGDRTTTALPTLWVQWSSGAFLDLNSEDGLGLGWHLSDDPAFEYGPQLRFSSREQRSDTPGQRGGLATEAGLFLTYRVEHNISAGANAMASSGSSGLGLRAHLWTEASTPVAAHHTLSLGAGVLLANQRYLQEYFGVTAQQAAVEANALYAPRQGVLSMYLQPSWTWQLGNKYTLDTWLRVSRLGGQAAASPLVGQRNRAIVSTALTYHY
ncbi:MULTISPECIES: MipA/OmpV family protein [unclassified Duganella]|uniref:MipA/OmpV family protein n=1 Tax=unclassified Duganella TaxID=2636909 RepID=UPI000E34AD45|nr:MULTISPECIES: MipA/OmpV family protein [unclassified Duganella]RFP10068.1 MipA/OmpV family protein [Duganella sp. BJB475]RFP25626.1 MipA/OmpV family protein [Duganella sp. BJB476]